MRPKGREPVEKVSVSARVGIVDATKTNWVQDELR